METRRTRTGKTGKWAVKGKAVPAPAALQKPEYRYSQKVTFHNKNQLVSASTALQLDQSDQRQRLYVATGQAKQAITP